MSLQQLDAPTRLRFPTVTAPNLSAVAPRIALAGIAALAGILRFESLGGVPLNPYYDAAVRSMGSSWHAFLVGAFDPNASVAIDKPPLDLWLQVATTKLVGFTHFALLLPEALASTAAVLLLYDAVRRAFGRTAGLGAAAALAVLPVAVVTARSDTMDGVMMALLVLAFWLIVRAIEKGRALELYAAGAVVGLAFETKLFEALVGLPALAVIFLVGSTARWPRRLGQLALGGAAMVAAGLVWTVGFALAPAAQRPYPMGSTTGSIWDTIFVYNGIGRLTSRSTLTPTDQLSPPGVTRLVSAGPVHLDLLIGSVLLAAIAFGAAALVTRLAGRHGRKWGRLPCAVAIGMGIWLVTGVAVLSSMKHMPVRYLEAFIPAIAAVLGIGVAYLARTASRGDSHGKGHRYVVSSLLLVAALVGVLIYQAAARTLPAGAFVGVAGAAIAIPITWLLVRRRASHHLAAAFSSVLAGVVLLAVLAAPASESFAQVRGDTSDGGALGAMPGKTIRALSTYLTHHRGNTRYAYASAEAALAAPLIVANDQPVLIAAGTPFHPLVSARGLSRAVRAGQVRYVLLSNVPTDHLIHPFWPHSDRSAIPSWVVRHGVDVTRQTGIHGYGMLYRVSARR